MNWKDKLYTHYVSSEQAGGHTTAGDDPFRHNRPYIEQVIRQYFPPDPNTRVLDIGCGHGTYLFFAKEKGYRRVKGIDLSAEQVALAHRLGIAEVEQADIDVYLSQTQEKFDLVLMMDVLEHLEPQQLFDTLEKVRGILEPGGLLVVHIPNAEGLFGMRIRYGDYTHTQAFTPKSIRQVLLTNGFGDIRCIEDRPVVHGVKSLIRSILWRLGTIGPRLLLMAETGETQSVLSQNMLVLAKRPA